MPADMRPLALVAGALAALVIAGLLGWSLVAIGRVSWDFVQAHFASQAAFREWIHGFGPWAPAVYFVTVAAQVVVAPIPGSVLPPVGSAAFGPMTALVLTVAGTMLGSAAMFALARWFGRPLVARLVGQKHLDHYAGLVADRGGLWLFVIYLLPLLPDDAVCAVAGLSPISFRRFLLLSTLGRLPGSVLSVYAFAGLLAAPPWIWAVAALALASAVVVAITYRDRLENWVLGHGRASGADADPAANA
jgi:uncharacterized membrane protein YdjX (TVP38/TMEM64 family)